MSKPKILIVDDEESIRTQMRWALSADYEVLQASNRAEALSTMAMEEPSVVLLDLGLPPHTDSSVEGFAALSEIRSRWPITRVIVVTGNDEHDTALDAVSRGAHDFFAKPVEIADLEVLLRRNLQMVELERENLRLRKEIEEREGTEGRILGTSRPMVELMAMVDKVAHSEAPVLITGESGTGKELIARALHERSARARGPFVAINCGAIPENLLESELFGHEKGAFTGAHALNKGKVEYADGGTLLLDEIGEMPLHLQVKLLRFLQERTIERVGGHNLIEVDVRVVSATNIDLHEAILAKTFREDLFFRLNTVQLHLPPLRERSNDAALIANTVVQRYNGQHGTKITLTNEAFDAISAYEWPGNVRELLNRLNRALIVAGGERITPADLELAGRDQAPTIFDLRTARERVERAVIIKALEKNGGNISRAAVDLGTSRPTLHHLLNKYEITAREYTRA
ncbi:MAG: PEP-CTERM-box response regulator transcription factor [Nitrospirae bacterium CG18_big_fil_WC_8_21_14_2_50_70_55]|nr:PEP-CTERM-box response regulator transcription factor [Deltaproteobacteria bacterium]OIP66355.1 MAG: PEP-CTERM-box response regulator transcription factor [Nitrospirae bacterium CG2_30_70_394]PIQ07215.1 MAG: PEP-CTERM-box response regulator transcription factor [Nitrospirae bacterium CG18_big_fil_WC_8_21_14_2_50_70_55]PIU78488.1 MAG: PEP-CTERM-box response regulator transcription factor [Nitrospirae bacterium CG06_land_8_20_14_3_00_70_43]PIW83207.1 MAG: PEP-CTERM-box response regulator trans